MPLWDADNRLADDRCAILARLRDNESLQAYTFYDKYGRCGRDCGERSTKLREFSTMQPNVVFWDGFGISPCEVGADSALKHDSAWTSAKERQQLPKRVFTSAPDLSRGDIVNACAESALISGEDTTELRQCSRLSEVAYDRFVPGVDVQCAEHVVPAWTWGGDSSRDIARSPEFLEQIGYVVDASKNFTCYGDRRNGPQQTASTVVDESDNLLA